MKDISKMKNYREKYKRYYEIDFCSDYVIHHIDENRENNDIKNLLLLPRDLHSKYHTYKEAFLRTVPDGLCLDLEYSSKMLRDWQLSELSTLVKTLKEIEYWIELKCLADRGYPSYSSLDLMKEVD